MAQSLRELERAQQAGELLELAALSEGGLRSAFEDVAGLLDAEMFHLFNFTRPEAPDMIVSPARTAIYEDYLGKGWHESDIWSHSAAKIARHGRILTDSGMLPDEVKTRHPFYQEFCRNWRIGSFTAWTFDLGGQRWSYTLMGRPGAAARSGDAAYLRFIEAADRASLLASMTEKVRSCGMAEGIEIGGRPALVLDHHGRVMFMTSSVERLLGDGLAIRQGRLHGRTAAADHAFRRLAVDAMSPAARPLRNFVVQRGQGRRPLVAMPVHLRDHGLHGLSGARILLMLADLEVGANGRSGAVGQVFGLSPRECELAGHLMAGLPLLEAADVMGVTQNTGRQMLKTMFAKTGVRRQVELVALLARFMT